jgi:hypothetical protein
MVQLYDSHRSVASDPVPKSPHKGLSGMGIAMADAKNNQVIVPVIIPVPEVSDQKTDYLTPPPKNQVKGVSILQTSQRDLRVSNESIDLKQSPVIEHFSEQYDQESHESQEELIDALDY